MKKSLPFLTLLAAFVWVGCSKELSLESGAPPAGNNAVGTLVGAPGACANITLAGVYGQAIASDTSDYLLVDLDFTTAGDFIISTDTVNGMFFADTGSVANTGIAQLKLQAFGSPLNPGVFNYTVKFKGSSCTFSLEVFPVVTSTGNDYFPTSLNSWWNYISNDPAAAPSDTVRSIATGTTITLAATGRQYDIFQNVYHTAVTDTSLYRKAPGEYFAYDDIDQFGLADTVIAGEWIFLKDNVAAGTSWFSPEVNTTAASVPVKMRLKMDITQRNVDAAVDNKVYRNVIKVRTTQQVQATAVAPFVDVVSFESWYARGIGLIQVAAPSPFFGYRLQAFVVN
ncbi:hypothetical protein [Phnomibacter sp. MR]|uniref:hypothetical protein n=1 Tax=Phnomibacter sp. MR TaxID=3042318 RepID=UPI003A7F98D9